MKKLLQANKWREHAERSERDALRRKRKKDLIIAKRKRQRFAYKRRCAITCERTLPVLESAHIKPYAEAGPHRISNGLLLRSDLHKLFDLGYVTVTPDYHVEVSRRIKQEFENGRDYYALHGKPLISLPDSVIDRPAPDFIQWHNDHVYES